MFCACMQAEYESFCEKMDIDMADINVIIEHKISLAQLHVFREKFEAEFKLPLGVAHTLGTHFDSLPACDQACCARSLLRLC